MCVAQNIYYESRNQSFSGRIAVGFVTLNRADFARISACNIVYAHNIKGCQFTWTCSKIKPAWETAAWKEALALAYISYNKMVADITSGAMYYYNPTLCKPKWAEAEIPVSNAFMRNGYFGDHRFLRPGSSDVYAMR